MRALIVVVALVASSPALAEDKDKSPWVTGVSNEDKAAAKVLLDAGNRKFVERDYLAALEDYKLAVAKWDHPAIRFNMVRCLIQLDRVIEATESLQLALKYGAAPLEEAVYTEALAYQKLLANEVGSISVRCTQAGVKLSLDGEPLLDCPGSQQRRVKPGRHQVLGILKGFLTKTTEVFVLGGTDERVALELEPIERAGKLVHRWPTWMPWVVVGAGFTVTGVGALIEYQSYKTMDDYDRALVAACLDTGCGPDHPLPEKIADQKARAQLQNRIAVTTMAIGAATVITGGVLLYLNRARTVYPSEYIDVVPMRGGAAVSLSGRF